MMWSDSERDYLWKVVADPNVVAMYARNPGKALVSDADGNVVQRARGRPAGVTGSVYKDIVAYALPGYLAKFSERLPGETPLEFAQRTKMRKVHSLTTRRMVEETEDDWRKRLDRPTLNKVEHIIRAIFPSANHPSSDFTNSSRTLAPTESLK